jgi:NTP pyrophosphatase (non-canonical NTP hydrolase)
MKFEDFKTNVQQWATERGIYEHSTATAQALKAVSEVGELADAVIKNDSDALIDAIGDVAVCLVNVVRMERAALSYGYIFNNDPLGEAMTIEKATAFLSYAVANVCYSVGRGEGSHPVDEVLDCSFYGLYSLSRLAGLDFVQCCESAWNEIKNRTGRMVPGGAFVKE